MMWGSFAYCIFLFLSLWKSVRAWDPKARDHACADFNHGAALAALAGLENVFVCPADGLARIVCSESFAMKEIQNVTQSKLKWDDVVIYMLIGPRSRTEAFMWWLPLMYEPLDIVMVADACPNNSIVTTGNITECNDAVTSNYKIVRDKFPSLRFHLVRALASDAGYNILSCKLRSGAAAVYDMFPNKKIYFKLDTDTIIFPKRLMSFYHTLNAVVDDNKPVYFGTVVESGMGMLLCGRDWANRGNVAKGGICYAQGGGGYGLNNFAMKWISSAPTCNASNPDKSPEDTFVALRIYDSYNVTVIHCGGFSSSEIMTDLRMRSSISFHYVDHKFLKSYGHSLLMHNNKKL